MGKVFYIINQEGFLEDVTFIEEIARLSNYTAVEMPEGLVNPRFNRETQTWEVGEFYTVYALVKENVVIDVTEEETEVVFGSFSRSISIESIRERIKKDIHVIKEGIIKRASSDEISSKLDSMTEEQKKYWVERQKTTYVSEYELKEQVSKVATELSVAMAEMINGVLGG